MEFAVVEGWRRLLGEWRYELGRGCRNAEEPASVRSFARRKGSSAVNYLPDFSYAIALPLPDSEAPLQGDELARLRGRAAAALSGAKLRLTPSAQALLAREPRLADAVG